VITIPSRHHSGASRRQQSDESRVSERRSCLASRQAILSPKKHGLYTNSGDARQREDIGKLSPACSLAQHVPVVFRGHLLKINEATNLCSERRGRGAARTLIRRCAGNGSETLRHIRLSFLACVPVVHDFQRGFKMHPGNLNLNARARSRVFWSRVV